MSPIKLLLVAVTLAVATASPLEYDLLLKGGHVINAKYRISAVRYVAIMDGTIAAVAADIPASDAWKTVNAKGLYVAPGRSICTCTFKQAPERRLRMRATLACTRTASRYATE